MKGLQCLIFYMNFWRKKLFHVINFNEIGEWLTTLKRLPIHIIAQK